jgi:hypothetical protein
MLKTVVTYSYNFVRNALSQFLLLKMLPSINITIANMMTPSIILSKAPEGRQTTTQVRYQTTGPRYGMRFIRR